MAHDRIKWLVPISVAVNSQGLSACRCRMRCKLRWLSGAVEDLRNVGKNVTREADSNGGLQSCSRNLNPSTLKKKKKKKKKKKEKKRGYPHKVASGY